MFGFLKKIFGLPTKEEIETAKKESAPYKLESPVVNNKTGDVVEVSPIPYPKLHEAPVAVGSLQSTPVDSQVTDAVTQVKKPRKPRAVKASTKKVETKVTSKKSPGRKPKAVK